MIVIVDIDGTIAEVSEERSRLAEAGKWKKFHKKCHKDNPNINVIKIVKALQKDNVIIFCTGRTAYRIVVKKTQKWISKHVGIECILGCNLLMRSIGDERSDVVVKMENTKLNSITPEKTLCVLEDKNSMVAEWRRRGFTCLQVREGYDTK